MTVPENSLSFVGFTGEGRRLEGAWAIYPNSTLFKAGSYPDKKFEMTVEDIDRACKLFDPCVANRGNIEHTSFLSGRATRVRKVWRDGDLMRGEVAIPAALDELMTDDERKLSCEFDVRAKTLDCVALTTDPRVKEAALMSAYATFARHDTDQGQYALQAMHDHACRHGAVCDKKNIEMSSRHEATAIQQVHDTCVEHGAKCASTAGNRPALFAGHGGKERAMPTLKERIIALFTSAGLAPDEEADDAKFSAAIGKLGSVAAPAKPAESEEIKDLRARIVKMSNDQRLKDAEAFAHQVIDVDKKALPRERVSIAAAYFQAASDDEATPTKVLFANDKGEQAEGSRVDQLKALYAVRAPHVLTEEILKDAIADDASGAYALFNKATTPDPNKEQGSGHKKEKLLSMSDLGRQVLANGKGGN